MEKKAHEFAKKKFFQIKKQLHILSYMHGEEGMQLPVTFTNGEYVICMGGRHLEAVLFGSSGHSSSCRVLQWMYLV